VPPVLWPASSYDADGGDAAAQARKRKAADADGGAAAKRPR
jgi:hypothetical protein